MRRSAEWLVRDPVARSGLLVSLVAAIAAVNGTWAAAGVFGAVALLLLVWGRHRVTRPPR